VIYRIANKNARLYEACVVVISKKIALNFKQLFDRFDRVSFSSSGNLRSENTAKHHD